MNRMKTLTTCVFLALLAATTSAAQTYSAVLNFSGGSAGTSSPGQPTVDPSGTVFVPAYDDGLYGSVVLQDGYRIHRFNGTLGSGPLGGMVEDAAGNLFGVTDAGGAAGCGTAFELHRPVNGVIESYWEEEVLWTFGATSTDGCGPAGPLVPVGKNLFYGVAYNNPSATHSNSGSGLVYSLTRTSGGWQEQVLYRFGAVPGGFNPEGNLLRAQDGSLIGITVHGGNCLDGTLYRLSQTSSGTWTKKIIHNFCGTDGVVPDNHLTMDGSGVIYGTTLSGGAYDFGEIFSYDPRSQVFSVIYSFQNGSDGASPGGLVWRPADGYLYGGSEAGGSSACGYGCGVIFRYPARVGTGGTPEVLHVFLGSPTDGQSVYAPFAMSADGRLMYGTTLFGGTASVPSGTLFQLAF